MSMPIKPTGSGLAPFSAIERPEASMAPDRPGESFGDVFKRAIGDTQELQGNAQDMIAAFLRGDPVELHQVMAASEEATISLELLVEIRNKVTEAYRSVMNVQ